MVFVTKFRVKQCFSVNLKKLHNLSYTAIFLGCKQYEYLFCFRMYSTSKKIIFCDKVYIAKKCYSAFVSDFLMAQGNFLLNKSFLYSLSNYFLIHMIHVYQTYLKDFLLRRISNYMSCPFSYNISRHDDTLLVTPSAYILSFIFINKSKATKL